MQIDRPSKVAIEPVVGLMELDQFFGDFRQIIEGLEHAYQNNCLAESLSNPSVEQCIGTAVYSQYERLVHLPVFPDPQGRRIETVHALLDQARELLFRVDASFRSEIEIDAGQLDGSVVGTTPVGQKRYRVTPCCGQPISLRIDQVMAIRNWGIELLLDDDYEKNRLVQLNFSHALIRFSRDMNHLAKMLPRQLRADPDKFPPMLAPRSGRVLELLIIDILNEHLQQAHLASLMEDYSQKTDIRVRYPDLERKRGARVQVTWASTQSRHEQKSNSIARTDQYVVLSPWSLANAVPQLGRGINNRDNDGVDFEASLLNRFWACIGAQPSEVKSLALVLRQIFDNAIIYPVRDPRGPMALVPEPVREFIRHWVRFEAIRSTRALRHWQADGGTIQTRRDGRLSVRSSADGGYSR